MNDKTWKIACLVELCLLMAALLISTFMGGCTKQIECTSGNVPMKCYWTFLAVPLICIPGGWAVFAAAVSGEKKVRRVAMLSALLSAVCSLLCIWVVIGICTGAGSHGCTPTAIATSVALGLSAALAVVLIAMADPKAADQPKMKL